MKNSHIGQCSRCGCFLWRCSSVEAHDGVGELVHQPYNAASALARQAHPVQRRAVAEVVGPLGVISAAVGPQRGQIRLRLLRAVEARIEDRDTVYENKTDSVVAYGTAQECADKLGIKKNRSTMHGVGKKLVE